MADTNVVGCNWIELPKTKYRVRSEEKGKKFNDFLSHISIIPRVFDTQE